MATAPRSRRFPALCGAVTEDEGLARLGSLVDLLVIQIDGLHVGDPWRRSVDGNGDKHVLAVVEGATNTVVVRPLDNLLARGLDPTLPRLFIVDGAKALSKAIRNTFGVAAAIQRCQVHKGVTSSSACPCICTRVKKALRQA